VAKRPEGYHARAMSSRSDPSSKQIKQITKEQFMVRDRMYCSGEYTFALSEFVNLVKA
jgi:hypothetical protein